MPVLQEFNSYEIFFEGWPQIIMPYCLGHPWSRNWYGTVVWWNKTWTFTILTHCHLISSTLVWKQLYEATTGRSSLFEGQTILHCQIFHAKGHLHWYDYYFLFHKKIVKNIVLAKRFTCPRSGSRTTLDYGRSHLISIVKPR